MLQEQNAKAAARQGLPGGPGCRWGFEFFRLGHTQDTQHDIIYVEGYITSEIYLEKS